MIYLYTVFRLIEVVIEWLKAGFLWPLNRSRKSPYDPSENEKSDSWARLNWGCKTQSVSISFRFCLWYFATRLVFSRGYSIPMTRQYPDLRRASDWVKKISDQSEALPRSGLQASSLWNFWARFSDAISWGNQSERSAVFSAKTTEIVGVALSRRCENEAVATLALTLCGSFSSFQSACDSDNLLCNRS